MGCLLAMERAPLGVTQQALKASYADGVLISSVLYAFGSFSHTPKNQKREAVWFLKKKSRWLRLHREGLGSRSQGTFLGRGPRSP